MTIVFLKRGCTTCCMAATKYVKQLHAPLRAFFQSLLHTCISRCQQGHVHDITLAKALRWSVYEQCHFRSVCWHCFAMQWHVCSSLSCLPACRMQSRDFTMCSMFCTVHVMATARKRKASSLGNWMLMAFWDKSVSETFGVLNLLYRPLKGS